MLTGLRIRLVRRMFGLRMILGLRSVGLRLLRGRRRLGWTRLDVDAFSPRRRLRGLAVPQSDAREAAFPLATLAGSVSALSAFRVRFLRSFNNTLGLCFLSHIHIGIAASQLFGGDSM